jgi:hypothetical protein
MEILYTGILLPNEVKSLFQKIFPDCFQEPFTLEFCHHVTLNYQPSEVQITKTEFGKEVIVDFLKVYKNQTVAVAVCDFNGVKEYGVEHPHMTISTANQMPVESRNLLQRIKEVGYKNLPAEEIPEIHMWYHETYPSFVGKIVGFDQNNQVIRS